jgi:hypothetical protein
MPLRLVTTSYGLFISSSIPYIHFIITRKICGEVICKFSVPNSKNFYVSSGSLRDSFIFVDFLVEA